MTDNNDNTAQVPALDYLFHPRSIAVVGASTDPTSQGNRYVRLMQSFGFKGPVYPVNPGASAVAGLRAYPSLLDVPGPVDYVISCVPAHLVLQLAGECVEKEAKVLHLFTARLRETALPEMMEMERRMVETARSGGVRVIGPNCMGLYYPKEGMSFRFSFPKEPGSVGFISQSGGNTQAMVNRSAPRGVRFSKIISYGNAADLNEADFMEYFADDPETSIITGYIEGVRDGRRFFKAVAKAATSKPVILLKAGRTSAGNRAVASHTASLGGDEVLWDAFFKQTSAIRARNIEEMADLALAFQTLKPPSGYRAAVMGGGGGESVAAADACEGAGLVVPPLPAYIRDEIKEVAPYTWSMVSNPLDSSATGGANVFRGVAERLAKDPAIDLIVGNGTPDWALDEERGVGNYVEGIRYLIRLSKEVGKPVAMVIGSVDGLGEWWREAIEEAQGLCLEARLPVFPSVERAANAISKVVSYHINRVGTPSKEPSSTGAVVS